jgi:hypothetical protein
MIEIASARFVPRFKHVIVCFMKSCASMNRQLHVCSVWRSEDNLGEGKTKTNGRHACENDGQQWEQQLGELGTKWQKKKKKKWWQKKMNFVKT